MSGGGARGEALSIRRSGFERAARAAAQAFARSGARARALRVRALALSAGALAAFAAKAFYARAGARELELVLAPTAALVELATGARFEREPGAGYLSRDPAYLIAPVCAGLNFTIAAFATLAIALAPRFRDVASSAAWLLAAAALALAVTPLANAARIALDLHLRASALPAWLPAQQLHRVEGVAIYLGALWALHAAAARAHRVLAVAIPLAVYLTVTLLVPLANGAGSEPAFWLHARGVLAASLALSAAVLAVAHRSGSAHD